MPALVYDATTQPAYSFGLAAVVLLKLDSHPGQWLSVAAIATHSHCTEAQARTHLDTLAANNLVRVHRQTAEGELQGEVVEAMAWLGEHI